MRSLRSLFALVAISMSIATIANPACADDYPTRPVALIVPSAPGGTTDISARLLAEGLSRALGKQFIVENRDGASGNIGITAASRARPDGYTLLLTYSGYQVTNPSLFPSLPWDPVKSFAPVALIVKAPHVILARKELPVSSLTDLVRLIKEKPGTITFASSGPGSIQHIGGETLQQMIGSKMVHVPYRGAGPALNDLLAGKVDLFITTPPSAVGHIRSGALKALALAAPERSSMMPEVLTTAEAGLPGFELVAWFALYAPAKTSPEIIEKLGNAVRTVVESDDFRKRVADLGANAVYLGPQALATFQAEELARWGDVIRKANIRIE